MDHAAVERADRVAVRRLGLFALQTSLAMRDGEVVVAAVEAPDLFEPLPNGIALAVPGEFVAVNQLARRDAADNDPRLEAKAVGGVRQVASRFPTAAAGVVEPLLRVVRQRIAR